MARLLEEIKLDVNFVIYRAKTQRFQHSWLDFVVAEENGKRVAKSIGRCYYTAIVIHALLSVAISQALPLG